MFFPFGPPNRLQTLSAVTAINTGAMIGSIDAADQACAQGDRCARANQVDFLIELLSTRKARVRSLYAGCSETD
jgi:hypothetical protein